MAIISHLKKVRTEKSLLQEDVAQAVGACSRSISRIECGERNPSLEIALRMAKYFEMSVEELFEIEE